MFQAQMAPQKTKNVQPRSEICALVKDISIFLFKACFLPVASSPSGYSRQSVFFLMLLFFSLKCNYFNPVQQIIWAFPSFKSKVCT